VIKYELDWQDRSALAIELHMIQRGGQWTEDGITYGHGLEYHFLAARALAWPKRYRHRWTDLIYHEIIKNQISIFMGAASTQKTGHISEWCLLDYWAHPQNTFILVSTVNTDKLETNIFGELKMLFQEGRDRYPELSGNLLDHKHAITTDAIRDNDFDEARARDMRKGIMGRPCYVGGRHVGLGVFAGIKQERFRFVGDELQFMAPTFMDSWSHMFSNPDVKIIGSGNPNHDPDDQLGLAAEPIDGWAAMPEPAKTCTWPTKRMGAVCVNLVGLDSPNFDQPEDIYPRLIGRRYVARLLHDCGENSPDYYRLAKGVMKLGLASDRVITRQLCQQHGAHDPAYWSGATRTKIHALDPAYGGGDRCTSMRGEFGESIDGKEIIAVVHYRIIRINLLDPRRPETQIAQSVKEELEQNGIPPSNSFYDSFGKGTMGFAFAEEFGADCPVPVDSGQRCTNRPVREGLLVQDEYSGQWRLKRCDEHYSKFVTEMWFSCRYAIEASQARQLPEEVMAEGCWRQYYTVQGNKIEVESKKDMREKKGKSPDLFDVYAVMMEGARRRGFKISQLVSVLTEAGQEDSLTTEAEEYEAMLKGKMLTHA
jgi:hypothetical protein